METGATSACAQALIMAIGRSGWPVQPLRLLQRPVADKGRRASKKSQGIVMSSTRPFVSHGWNKSMQYCEGEVFKQQSVLYISMWCKISTDPSTNHDHYDAMVLYTSMWCLNSASIMTNTMPGCTWDPATTHRHVRKRSGLNSRNIAKGRRCTRGTLSIRPIGAMKNPSIHWGRDGPWTPGGTCVPGTKSFADGMEIPSRNVQIYLVR